VCRGQAGDASVAEVGSIQLVVKLEGARWSGAGDWLWQGAGAVVCREQVCTVWGSRRLATGRLDRTLAWNGGATRITQGYPDATPSCGTKAGQPARHGSICAHTALGTLRGPVMMWCTCEYEWMWVGVWVRHVVGLVAVAGSCGWRRRLSLAPLRCRFITCRWLSPWRPYTGSWPGGAGPPCGPP